MEGVKMSEVALSAASYQRHQVSVCSVASNSSRSVEAIQSVSTTGPVIINGTCVLAVALCWSPGISRMNVESLCGLLQSEIVQPGVLGKTVVEEDIIATNDNFYKQFINHLWSLSRPSIISLTQ